MDPHALAARHGYPPEIGDHLARIVGALALRDGESLVLLGSTPRGEFSFLREGGRFVPLSDYEFLLVTPEPRARDLSPLAVIEEEMAAGSPLFHVDVSPITPAALRRLPRILRHFETKARGATIAGADRIPDLPDVTLACLDFGDVNEIPLWRLWSLLLHLPADRPDAVDGDHATVLNYLACRNGLDLTTWLLPWEGVLLPSFRERLAHVEENAARLTWLRSFGEPFLPFLHRCAEGKLHLRFDRDWRGNYADAVRCLITAGDLVLSGMALPIASGRHGVVGFPDWNARRKAHEARALLRGEVERRDRVRWLARGKYSAIYLVLRALHRAWIARHHDGRDGAREIADARAVLDRIATRPSATPPRGDDFAAAWTRERRRLAEFLMAYFPSLGAKRAYVLHALGEA